MTRPYATLLVVTFCALIALPGFTLAIWRSPQPLPKVRPVEYPAFQASWDWPPAFEGYFTANFGQKRRLVQLHNALGYFVLGDLQSANVLAGRGGWLFLKQSFGWEAFRSALSMSEEEKAAWQQPLQGAKSQLDSRQIPFIFVIAPSKETIYPEFLPASATPARHVKRVDEMLPVLSAAGIDYLDLRAPLRDAKRDLPLYDKLDSHWNGRGAEVAAKLLLERAAAVLARPPTYASLSSQLAPVPSPNDLGQLVALADQLTEESVALVPLEPRARRLEPPAAKRLPKQPRRLVFEVSDASLPKALIIRDSFGTMLIPVLAEKFRRSVWLWTPQLDLRVLDEERPDIVIYEMAERLFHDVPPKLMLPRKRR